MATQSAASSDFIKNLGRMYGLYTGGFLGFIIFLAILEQMGVPNKVLGYFFVFFDLIDFARCSAALYSSLACSSLSFAALTANSSLLISRPGK